MEPSTFIPKSVLEKATGCQILSYQVEPGSKLGENYWSMIYSIKAELIPPDSSTPEIRHYIMKCISDNPERLKYMIEGNITFNELHFYKTWLKALLSFQTEVVGLTQEEIIKPKFPPFVGGEAVNFKDPTADATNLEPMNNFILLTDIKRTFGYEMVHKLKGLDPDHLRLVFQELAVIHALSWCYKQKVAEGKDILKRFPFLEVQLTEKEKGAMMNILKGNKKLAVETLEEVLGQGDELARKTRDFGGDLTELIDLYRYKRGKNTEMELLKFHRNLSEGMEGAIKSEEPWRVIIHSDVWTNNMMFKYDKITKKPESVILFDLQRAREGCPTVDMVYCLYNCSTAETRRSHLSELLQIYHDRFIEVCGTLKAEALPGFTLETLKRRFHLSKPLGFMMALLALPIMLKEEKNEVDMGENMTLESSFVGSKGSSLYGERIIEVAKEMCNDGVI